MLLFENLFKSQKNDKNNSQTPTHLTDLNSTRKNSQEGKKIIIVENNMEKSNLDINETNKNYIKNLQLNENKEVNPAATSMGVMEDCSFKTKQSIVVCPPCNWTSSKNSIEELLTHCATAFHKMKLKQRFENNGYSGGESSVNKGEVMQNVIHKKRQQGNEDVNFITDKSLLRNLEPVSNLNNLQHLGNISEKVGSKRNNKKNKRGNKAPNVPGKTFSKSSDKLNEIYDVSNINIKESRTAQKANSRLEKQLSLGERKFERTSKLPNDTTRKDLSLLESQTDLLKNVKTSSNIVFDKCVEKKIIFHNLQDNKVLKNLTSPSNYSNKKVKSKSRANIVDTKPIQTQEDPNPLAKKIMENQGLSSFVLEKVLPDNNPSKAVPKTEARAFQNLYKREKQPSSSSTAQKQTPADMSFISFTPDKAAKCEICQTTIPLAKDFHSLMENVSTHINGIKHIKKKRLLRDAISKAVDALN